MAENNTSEVRNKGKKALCNTSEVLNKAKMALFNT
jgi:hypothetical protein